MTTEIIEATTQKVGQRFACFGGGRDSEWNPLAKALKDKHLQFAAGVDVRGVVEFVLDAYYAERYTPVGE